MAALQEKLDKTQTAYTVKTDILIIELADTLSAIPIIEACKEDIVMFEVKSGSMDDAFINITGVV